MVQEALKAAQTLKEHGLNVSVCNVSSIKPLDVDGILKLAQAHECCFALEEHNIYGGLYSALSEALAPHQVTKLFPIGVKDTFGESGKAKDVLKKYGLTAENVTCEVLKVIQK